MRLQSSLQAKISKTKKRLSETADLQGVALFALASLILCFSGMMAIVMAPGSHAIVKSEFPLVPATLEDYGLHRFTERPQRFIKATTPAVILTMDAIFLGDLDAFSEKYPDARSKIRVAHKDSAPQVGKFLAAMKKWIDAKKGENGWRNEGILVFAPVNDIPASIVIEVMKALQSDGTFERVILASGLI
jgi:hypothetical protein